MNELVETIAKIESDYIERIMKVADEYDRNAAALLAASAMHLLHIVHRGVFSDEQADDQRDAETSS